MNLYQLLNEELKRMTEERDKLYHMIISSGGRRSMFNDQLANGRYDNMDFQMIHRRFEEIDFGIKEIRTKLITALESHDARVQEKVAELALMGTAET